MATKKETAPEAPPKADDWWGAIYLAVCSAAGAGLMVYYNTTSEVMGFGVGLLVAPLFGFIYKGILSVFRK